MENDAEKSRLVVGLMSGTSLDGVDVALAQLKGTGRDMEVSLLHFSSNPYSEALRTLLLKNSRPESSSVLELSQLNVRLAHVYAGAVTEMVTEAGYSMGDIDLVGCHGQTVYHVPDAADCAGQLTRSTLQIGDPSTLANLLHTDVVGDFRLADMAFGGQGAPLVPYFDYVYFSHPTENRLLLNIGGIGNLSVLPAGSGMEQVQAFDTGPGNMLSDALVQHFWNETYDQGGQRALSGTCNQEFLDLLLEDPYYHRTPPKSTGREFYNDAYVKWLLEEAERLGVTKPEDILATVVVLTVETIWQGYRDFIQPAHKVDRVIASGGGVHNAGIMQGLRDRFAPAQVCSMDELGLNPDAKEAVCFAVLAHETINRVASNVPAATGASRPAIMGKVCFAAG